MKKNSNSLVVIILAAGEGTRMYSAIPKVCHGLGEKSLLQHVVDVAKELRPHKIYVVYGYEGTKVKEKIIDQNIKWVKQEKQLGTAHAISKVLPFLHKNERLLILYGDVPLISADTLKQVINKTAQNSIGIIVGDVDNPHGLGRIIRDGNNNIQSIIEEKDATDKQKEIKEIFSGISFIPCQLFQKLWPKIKNNNAQKEYYLPDLIKLALKNGNTIYTHSVCEQNEILGINNRSQLAKVERVYQLKIAEAFMKKGVTIRDPNRFDVRGKANINNDVEIDINVILEGDVKIGQHSKIGANTIIRNSNIGKNVTILPNTIIDGANILDNCTIGPFARIRPDTTLEREVKIGNFVEIKKSRIKANTKINHLSYVGDAKVGKNVIIGAGTITCNYDGANKNVTIIEDNAFIGSDTQLVAPVKIGKNSTIGAGSTITKNTSNNTLVFCKIERKEIKNWNRPRKK